MAKRQDVDALKKRVQDAITQLPESNDVNSQIRVGKVAVSGVLCKPHSFTYFTAKAKEEIVQLMSELTGQKIDESFGMFPPFYTDCGAGSIHIGKKCFY